MTHPRAAIREAIRARLATAGAGGSFPTAAAERVFKSRLIPIDTNDDSELPAVLVYSRDEKRRIDVDYGPDAEDTWVRPELCIVVEGIVRAKENVDDRLDLLAEQIEAALEDWEIPGFEGAFVRLGDTDIDVIAEAGRKPVGAIGLVWHVRYERPWRARAPGTRPDTVNVRVRGDAPERIITHDQGLRQGAATEEQDIADGLPNWLISRSKPEKRW